MPTQEATKLNQKIKTVTEGRFPKPKPKLGSKEGEEETPQPAQDEIEDPSSSPDLGLLFIARLQFCTGCDIPENCWLALGNGDRAVCVRQSGHEYWEGIGQSDRGDDPLHCSKSSPPSEQP